jgi:hypothetical protein
VDELMDYLESKWQTWDTKRIERWFYPDFRILSDIHTKIKSMYLKRKLKELNHKESIINAIYHLSLTR